MHCVRAKKYCDLKPIVHVPLFYEANVSVRESQLGARQARIRQRSAYRALRRRRLVESYVNRILRARR
jgi:hypothetical protein